MRRIITLGGAKVTMQRDMEKTIFNPQHFDGLSCRRRRRNPRANNQHRLLLDKSHEERLSLSSRFARIFLLIQG
jgi:hypothetical protein